MTAPYLFLYLDNTVSEAVALAAASATFTYSVEKMQEHIL